MEHIHPRPELNGPQLVLRAPKQADVDARLKLGTTLDIVRAFGGDETSLRSLTVDGAQMWVDAIAKEPFGWVIERDGSLIGEIRLHSFCYLDRRASLAIGIVDPNALSKGFGSEAMRLVADLAFDGMGLNRLSVRVLANNARAIRAYEKVGFTVEGRERQAARVAGSWCDDVIMGLLACDFAMDDAA